MALYIGIIYGNLLYCHDVSEVNLYTKLLTLEKNNRAVYECFDDPFTDKFGISYLNLPLTTIDDKPCPHKIALYTPDLIPAAISVSLENYFSNFTTPSDLPDLLTSDNTNPLHIMKKDYPCRGSLKRG